MCLPQEVLELEDLPSSADVPDELLPNRPEELLLLDVEPSLPQPEDEAPPLRPLPFSASASHSVSPPAEVEVDVAALAVLVAVELLRAEETVEVGLWRTTTTARSWTGAAATKLVLRRATRPARTWTRILECVSERVKK